MKRIIVFTGNVDYTVRKGVAELAARFPDTSFLVLLHKPTKSWRTVLRNQWRNLARNGWRWIPYQLAEILEIVARKRKQPLWHSRARPGQRYEDSVLFNGDRVVLETTHDIHAAASLQRVREFNPDLGISLAAPILESKLFQIPYQGTINLHKGKLPEYRGMPPAFWESLNNEAFVGCTVHRMEKGLDTGDILLERTITRQRHSTVQGLRLSLDELGVLMMADAVALIAAGRAQWRPQPAGGKSYRKPTLKQQAIMRSRERVRARTDSIARRLFKKGISTAYVSGYRPLSRRLKIGSRDTTEIVVLLYHRVNDELRDSVTVGIEQFHEQMAYLANNYPIASIEDIVKGNLPAAPVGKPVIAVTFDDGYYDNYLNAVPALLKYDIPAAFFVSTGMIGQESGFEHDLNKLGKALPNMDWDHLREMRNLGFTIGSHTVSHPNCAEIADQQLQNELRESRDHLIDELGLQDVLFAYPFGRKSAFSPKALRFVKEAGYTGCLSAYGGVNSEKLDIFNVLRMGVDFNFCPRRFAARVEGL